MSPFPSERCPIYGVVYINGSYPKAVKIPGFPNAFTAGVTRPAPLGVEKFLWNPQTHGFEKAWINREVNNSDIMVPVVSTKTGLLYCAHKENGDYQVRWSRLADGRNPRTLDLPR